MVHTPHLFIQSHKSLCHRGENNIENISFSEEILLLSTMLQKNDSLKFYIKYITPKAVVAVENQKPKLITLKKLSMKI